MSRSLHASEGGVHPERRATQRFPVVLQLAYKAFRQHTLIREGVGRTIDISSRGILFHPDAALEPGLRLELTIDWPLLHERGAQLRLLAFGEVVRLGEDRAAVRLARHEFQKHAAQGG